MIIAVAIGVLAAIVLLVVLIAAAGGRDPLSGGLNDEPVNLGGPPGGPIPPDGRPIPQAGTDVFLGGGVIEFPVPQGWQQVARGDNKPGPGGHPESAVLVNRAAGVSFSVYVYPPADLAARVNEEALARAQEWVKDGDQPVVTNPQPFDIGGTVQASASLRYAYVQKGPGGGGREGELVFAVRRDGFGVAVFVDTGQGGALDATAGQWSPLRAAALRNFASG